MTKLIFLDIDGVLNYQMMPKNEIVGISTGRVSSKCVGLLNKLVKDTDAQIVVTSTWRKDSTCCIQTLKDLGVEAQFHGITPDFPEFYTYRGNEIMHYIKEHESELGCYSKYRNYVILDDDNDMLLWQKDNYIHVDPWSGITPHTCFLAKNILNQ